FDLEMLRRQRSGGERRRKTTGKREGTLRERSFRCPSLGRHGAQLNARILDHQSHAPKAAHGEDPLAVEVRPEGGALLARQAQESEMKPAWRTDSHHVLLSCSEWCA